MWAFLIILGLLCFFYLSVLIVKIHIIIISSETTGLIGSQFTGIILILSWSGRIHDCDKDKSCFWLGWNFSPEITNPSDLVVSLKYIYIYIYLSKKDSYFIHKATLQLNSIWLALTDLWSFIAKVHILYTDI